MDLVPMDLRATIEDAAGQVRPLADERGIELSTDGDDGIALRGDPRRLRQVLVNLLANAVKYTPPGGHVRLGVELDREGLRLSVLDTGIGIDLADLERAFDPFERLAGTEVPGAGLGLPIARRIMELHGGGLTATSLPGLGSVFTAHLPPESILEPGASGTPDTTPPSPPPSARLRAIA
jgi:signal transduction histidine kinase